MKFYILKIVAQWPIILVGTFSGLLGSLIDSLLGETLQYSGNSSRMLFV